MRGALHEIIEAGIAAVDGEVARWRIAPAPSEEMPAPGPLASWSSSVARTTQTTTAARSLIDVDIVKDVFHRDCVDQPDKVAFRRRTERLALDETSQILPPWIVRMGACLS